MSNELLYLLIHCADTRPGYKVTKEILEQWHKGPRDITEGTKLVGVKYKGQDYPSRSHLPDEEIGGTNIVYLHGRGWDRYGYSDLIKRDGSIINLTPYDNDHLVQSHEMTWGAAGVNKNSRHVCLEGGRNEKNESGVYLFEDIFTDAQFTTLIGYVKQFLKDQPQAKIGGHNLFSEKTCPNFNVSGLMLLAGISGDRLINDFPS